MSTIKVRLREVVHGAASFCFMMLLLAALDAGYSRLGWWGFVAVVLLTLLIMSLNWRMICRFILWVVKC